MRAVASGNSSDLQGLIGAFSCSSCGLCEMFACGQGLNPRTLIGELKGKMRAGGIMPPKGLEADSVDKMRDYKRVPMSKLISRLGLAKYDVEAPILDTQVSSDSLKIMLSQSIGVPSAPCVKAGDRVKAGDVLGTFDESKLGTAVHSPVNGTVKEVTDKFIIVEP